MYLEDRSLADGCCPAGLLLPAAVCWLEPEREQFSFFFGGFNSNFLVLLSSISHVSGFSLK
jgi:hypothetical protein